MIGFLVQTTLLFAILYYFPFFGPVMDEAGIVGATIISILASAALFFVYDLWKSPILIDRYQREDLASAVEVARDVINSETRMRQLGEFYEDGRKKLAGRMKPAVLEGAFRDWLSICEDYLEGNFNFSKLHEFRSAKPVSVYKVFDNNSAMLPPEKEIRNAWEGKLSALNHIISEGDISVMPAISMQRIVEASEQPIYRFLLPERKTGKT